MASNEPMLPVPPPEGESGFEPMRPFRHLDEVPPSLFHAGLPVLVVEHDGWRCWFWRGYLLAPAKGTRMRRKTVRRDWAVLVARDGRVRPAVNRDAQHIRFAVLFDARLPPLRTRPNRWNLALDTVEKNLASKEDQDR